MAVASLAWAIVGWLAATLAPQLAFLPRIEILHALLPGVTLALIAVNLGYALQAVFRHRVPIERLLLVTTAQLVLFTTLFFQIDAHFEANCYWIDGPTDPWMWLGFSAAHALRALDILDWWPGWWCCITLWWICSCLDCSG